MIGYGLLLQSGLLHLLLVLSKMILFDYQTVNR